MSGFFPWNFRAGRSAGGGIEATGCPLEDHPNWSIAVGTGPSNLCWDSMDGKSVLVNANSDDIVNLAYRNINMVSGSIAATISMVSTSDQDWMLPLCARMINGNNLIGARWNNGKFEVVQRKVGTWTSLFSGGPTPALDDRVIFLLSSKFWKLIVNGAVVGEGETTLPDDPGYWGMSQHRSPGFVGHRLFSGFEITDTSLAKMPCMTSNTTPYGEASTSSSFDGGYPAWRGMNCTTNFGSDAWVSAVGQPMPQWLQWIGPAGQPAMVPDRLHVVGRNITASHNTTYGPKKLTLLGSNDNGQSWEEIHTWDDLDFGATRTMDLPITGAKAFMAVRLRVDEVRQTDPAAELTQIGTFTVYGHAGAVSLASVAFSGAVVERTDDAVYLSDIAAGGDSDDRAQLFSGTALVFDGTDDHVLTDNELSDGSDYTVCVTMVASSDALSFQGIATHFYGGGGLMLREAVINARANGIIDDKIISFSPVVPNRPYRVAFSVMSEGVVTLSVDGVKVSEEDMGAGNTTDDLTGHSTIFGCYDSLEYFFNGQISNVQVWDAAFSADDVAYDFDNSHRGALASERDGSSLTEANLKGFWPLFDGSGHIAHDHSDNANHGTLTGFAADDSQWIHQLSSPLVPQTALMGWCLGSNICLQSAELLTSPWGSFGVVAIEEGTNNGFGEKWFTVTDDNTGTSANIRQEVVLENKIYTLGAVVKKGSDESFSVAMYDQTDAEYVSRINFGWNGDILEIVEESTGTGKVVEIGNGEWRVYVETAVAVTAGNTFRLFMMPSVVGEQTDFYQYFSSAMLFSGGANAGAYISIVDAPAINALAPLDPWQVAGRFPRDFGEMNWNGRSYANAGNGADVNASTAIIIETIQNKAVNNSIERRLFYKGASYRQYSQADQSWVRMRIYQDSGDVLGPIYEFTTDNLQHIVYSFDRVTLKMYVDGVLVGSVDSTFPLEDIKIDSEPLILSLNTFNCLSQLSLFLIYKDADAQEIIDGDLDAWVAELYQKRVDQGFVPLSVENGGEAVTYHGQPIFYRRR